MIRLSLTIEIDGRHPIQIDKLVPIKLGTHLNGLPMISLTPGPEKLNGGAVEVLVQIPEAFPSAPPYNTLHMTISSLAANGGIKTSRNGSLIRPKSPVYRQLEAIQEELSSESLNALDRDYPQEPGNPS